MKSPRRGSSLPRQYAQKRSFSRGDLSVYENNPNLSFSSFRDQILASPKQIVVSSRESSPVTEPISETNEIDQIFQVKPSPDSLEIVSPEFKSAMDMANDDSPQIPNLSSDDSEPEMENILTQASIDQSAEVDAYTEQLRNTKMARSMHELRKMEKLFLFLSQPIKTLQEKNVFAHDDTLTDFNNQLSKRIQEVYDFKTILEQQKKK